MRYVGTSPHRIHVSNEVSMPAKLPVAIAAGVVATLGLVAIGVTGGVTAVLGPSLAAVTAAIVVLLGR